jgi:hypothetical protein
VAGRQRRNRGDLVQERHAGLRLGECGDHSDRLED